MSSQARLLKALEAGNQTDVQRLTSRIFGPSFSAKDEDGNTTLHWAIAGQSKPLLRLVLSKRVRVETKNKVPCECAEDAYDLLYGSHMPLELPERDTRLQYGLTAVHWAAQLGSDSLLQYLLGAGDEQKLVADRDRAGNTPLHLAAKYGHVAAITLLASRMQVADTPNEEGNTPLHLAAMAGQQAAVHALLEAGCSPNKKAVMTGDTALHMAAKRSFGDVVALLVDAGGDLEQRNAQQQRVLDLHGDAPEMLGGDSVV